MFVPLLLLTVTLAASVVALLFPALRDLLLVTGPAAIASLILVLFGVFRRESSNAPARPPAVKKSEGTWRFPQFSRHNPSNGELAEAPPRWIVVDGSNVMHWLDGTPRIEAVQDVLQALKARGFTPGVVFDANAGYLVAGQYLHHEGFGTLLGLPTDRVMVVPKGTVADEIVLAAARDLGARIVSNDRFRDWSVMHPEIGQPGHVVQGGYRNGALWLDLEYA